MTAALTLALGIGLSTAVFTVADVLLLRRLPVRDQDRLVLLWGETPDGRSANFPFSWDDARAFVRQPRSLERAAYFAYEGAWPETIRDGDRLSTLRRSAVSGGFFGVLGSRPALGRALGPEDDVIGAAPVAVLSYAAWQQQFGGDRAVLGRRIALHETGVVYAIVGIMPQGLDYPRGTDFWASITGSTSADGLKFRSFDVIARLAPGASPASARDEVTALFARHPEPFLRAVRGVVRGFPEFIIGDTKPALLAFAVAASLLLLITCINVANLLLVRGLGRSREIAVRSALGASRAMLVGQLLVENALLAIVGGAVGVAIAWATVRVFVSFAPANLPRLDEIGLNATALAGAVGITGLAMLIFALAPAALTSRAELQQMLGSGVRQSASRRSRRATEALVAGQLALALVVLSAAGLVAKSLVRLQRADLSFDPSHLLVVNLSVQRSRYGTVESQNALDQAMVDALKALPDVVDVSPVVAEPFTQGWTGRPQAEGQTPAEATVNPMLAMELVGPGYFRTLGLPVGQGRAFTDADRTGAPAVVMLSESAARHFWPNGGAVGRRMYLGSDKDPAVTVVGVVPDTRYRDLRHPQPTIYFPLAQSGFPFAPTNVVVRTRGEPAVAVASIRRAVAEAAPGVGVSSASPFATYLEGPLAQPRFNAVLLAVFAIAAVVLAAVGLFGVMMTMVGQRTRELGVRMALGATARDIRRLVLGRGLVIATVGAVVGLAGSVAANRLIASLLYEVSPADVVTLAVVAGLLMVVALVATFVPARASERIDPVVALRADG
jgi:putative ABC transport system permease protein